MVGKWCCCLAVMNTPCWGEPSAVWLWGRCFGGQGTSACSQAEDSIQRNSMAPCHWTQVVAIIADNYRCFKFVSGLFPELCVLAHFKRSKQPTISILISKWQWWETPKRCWRRRNATNGSDSQMRISALSQIQTLQSGSWLCGGAFPAFEVTFPADTFVWWRWAHTAIPDVQNGMQMV